MEKSHLSNQDSREEDLERVVSSFSQLATVPSEIHPIGKMRNATDARMLQL